MSEVPRFGNWSGMLSLESGGLCPRNDAVGPGGGRKDRTRGIWVRKKAWFKLACCSNNEGELSASLLNNSSHCANN